MQSQVPAARSSRGKALLVVAIAILLAAPLGGCKKSRTVKLYVGAGLRYAVEDLIREFEKQTGIKVEPDYGGSGMILSRVADNPDEVDLFMPGDVWYVDRLHEKTGLVEPKDRAKVAYFVPVIIVRKGNQEEIHELKHFFRDDVKAAIGNTTEKGPRVGQIMPELFRKHNLDVSKLDAIQSLTVNELGNWVATGHADAAVVWRAIALNKAAEVDIIEIPREKNVISTVVVGILKNSKRRTDARKFMDFMTSDKGRSILKKRGYQIDPP
ncbi:MAG: molybdate ABC transporter substrate-binding protein [Planctomycetota bacterium]|jgi:molybdate transport system substrate-binding protein